MPRLLAVILDVTAVSIEEKDAHLYLFVSSMTHREVIEKTTATLGYDLQSTDEFEGFERGIVTLEWSDWAGIAHQFVPTRDKKQMKTHAAQIERDHPETKV